MSVHVSEAGKVAVEYDASFASGGLDVGRLGRNVGAVALASLPGALTIFLSFNAGGFYPGAQGAAVAVLAGVAAARMVLIRDPLAGFGWPLRIAVIALGFYSLWALVSSSWSHAPSRAIIDADLANLYLFALIVFGSTLRSYRRVRWTMVLTGVSILAVCVASLATRLRPDLFPIPLNLSPNRLAFPLTYWNALGLFAVVGLLLVLYLASSTREPRVLRVLATATLPIFAVTILLTYSRSALVVGVIGVVAFAVLARPRGIVGALLAGGPASAFVIADAYQAKLISNASTSLAAVQEGRHLTVSILIACLAAALGRVATLELDSRLASLMMSSTRRHNARIVLAFVCAGLLLGGVGAFGGTIASQWKSFTKQDSAVGTTDVRNRIANFRIGSRIGNWKIAIQAYDSNPGRGRGAGTFPIDFYEHRTNGGVALNAHSLYLEAMAELGAPGLVAIVVLLVLMIAACFMRSRRSSRSLWVALGVILLAWAAHAGVDWDWEMPAVTLPVIALGAAGLARRERGRRLPRRYDILVRAAIAASAVVVMFTALRIANSDRDLNRSVAAFNGGDCPAAVLSARTTIGDLSSRPQPYEVIGWCAALAGNRAAAPGYMAEAVRRDPQGWVYWYSLAVAKAAAGQNPHPALHQAVLLNPLGPLVIAAGVAFRGNDPRIWERNAIGLGTRIPTTPF